MIPFDSLNLASARLPANECDWPVGVTQVKSKFGQRVLWRPLPDCVYNGARRVPKDDVTTAAAAAAATTDGNDNTECQCQTCTRNDKAALLTSSRSKWRRRSCGGIGVGGYHLTSSQLERHRGIGDPYLDFILALLEKEGTPLGPGDDILKLARKSSSSISTTTAITGGQHHLRQFINQYQTLPTWVNLDQLQRGQLVFLAYAPAMSFTLYYRSLVAGFSIPKIAAVITSTGYLSPPSSGQRTMCRLIDTGALLTACMGTYGVTALLPGGKAWEACLYVRTLHAKVRHCLLNKQKRQNANNNNNHQDSNNQGRTNDKVEVQQQGCWNVQELGIPINQEDMAATLLAFSINPLLGVELISGKQVSSQEMMDYLALWRYIGWLLGVRTTVEMDEEEEDDEKDATRLKDVFLAQSPLLPTPIDPCGPGFFFNEQKPSCQSCNCIYSPEEEYLSIKHSYATLQSIVIHLLHPNQSSVEIAHHLLNASSGTTRRKNSIYYSNMFYFRSRICRHFIGNPLANELQLPQNHPNTLQNMIHIILSYILLICLRIYTLVAMYHGSPLRSLLVYIHWRCLKSAHVSWEKNHVTRMSKELRPGSCSASCAALNEAGTVVPDALELTRSVVNKDSNVTKSVGWIEHEGEMSLDTASDKLLQGCPFSMVARPSVSHVVVDNSL